MSGRPVFQNQFESRCWRHLNGGGPLGRFSVRNGGAQTVLDDVMKREGTVGSALLVSIVEHAGPDVTFETLRKVVSKARVRDCLPSVAAARALADRGETERAREMLEASLGSQETVNRSLAEARILQREGDMDGARAAAVRARSSDPSRAEAYEILEKVDPEGGWPQRRNIQDLVDGRMPEGQPGKGRLQQLYQIYFEWYRGNREAASDMLVNSPAYREQDPEYMLASARMSVDERDWHSARMMYDKLLADAPAFVRLEAAEARLSGGDPAGALELLAGADPALPRTMVCTIRALADLGRKREMLEAMRSYLDSEWCGSVEWKDAVSMLLDMGMDSEASSLLSRFLEFSPRDPDAMMMLSAVRVRNGDLPAALMAADVAVRGDPDSVPARIQRARVCLALGREARAEKECLGILDGDPGDRGALEVLRDVRLSRGDVEGAAEAARALIESDPSDASALVAMSPIMAAMGDADGAADMCRRAVRQDGTRDSHLRAVSSLVSSGLNRDAVYMCRDAESLFPDDAAFKRLRGNAEYAQGDFLKASVAFAEAAGLDPGNPVLWHSKGMADEARGDLESAADAYDRAISLDPDEPAYWVSRACVQRARGDDRAAVASLNRAMAKGDLAHAPVVKASILSAAGRHAEALGVLDVVLCADPADREALSERMRVQAASGDGEGALRTYAMIPDADESLRELAVGCGLVVASPLPEGAEAPPEAEMIEAPEGDVPEEVPDAPSQDDDGPYHYAMAMSLLEAGDAKGAMRAADRALASDPEETTYIAVKARAAVRLGDADGAVFMLSAALRESPDDPMLHLAMGEARASKGDLQAASEEFERAITLGLDDADAYAARGEVLERMGNADRAAECYSAAVTRDPDRLDLSERLARMMLSRREAMAADGMVNRILKRDPHRVSAILLKAEIAQSRGDDQGIMRAYSLFLDCDRPGSESTVRMVRILEDTGHAAEARQLVGDRRESTADSVRRYAERALRRACSTKASATDPDLMGALGLDQATSAKVHEYLTDIPDYGMIVPGTEEFRRMEAESREVVMKLKWADLEGQPDLPLEKVYVLCGYRDCDDAKRLVSYVRRAMTAVVQADDPRLTEMSMRLPKGMTVYEVMRECGIGVYEARAVKSLVI